LKKPVLVTGGSGYIASWVVKTLLDEGIEVRATVRNKNDKNKVEHLLKVAQGSNGKLTLHEADLLKDGSFEGPMDGCEAVFHMASPFSVEKVKDPSAALVRPALEGTRNVLNSVNNTPSVKRVVLTSSVVAMYGDASDIRATKRGVFDESYWNETSSLNHQPYSYSKKVAEEEAWKIANAQDRWDLVVINPGFVLGPSLSKRMDAQSIIFMASMLNGKYKAGTPDIHMAVVDVRDVARAHFLAATNSETSGRHILVERSMSFVDFARILREKYKDRYPIPRKALPKIMVYLLGPIMAGFTWKFITRNLGIPMKWDNSYSIKDLKIEYTPIEKTLIDHAEQLIHDELV
jgi:nucleoside-diphosphate-sugar epimerase